MSDVSNISSCAHTGLRFITQLSSSSSGIFSVIVSAATLDWLLCHLSGPARAMRLPWVCEPGKALLFLANPAGGGPLPDDPDPDSRGLIRDWLGKLLADSFVLLT